MNNLSQRIDKWLWCARFFKSRVLAQKLLQSGKIRINGNVVMKSHTKLSVGDELSFPQGGDLKEIKILSLAISRRPAAEARNLYEDYSYSDLRFEKFTSNDNLQVPKRGSGRPTKRDRRILDKFLSIG